MKTFLQEFKAFALRGNVMDLAVAVIIGGAFGKIITSLVNDIIMPLIGILIGGHDFKNLTLKYGNATISYGNFIQNVVDFLIIAFFIFIIIKLISKLQGTKDAEEPSTPQRSEEACLLEDIKNILSEKK